MTHDKATALREAAERVGVTHVENLAQLLHARSCAERGVEARWRGRNTNRAYYRRIARATRAEDLLEQAGEAFDAIAVFAQDSLSCGDLSGGDIGNTMAIRDAARAFLAKLKPADAPSGVTATGGELGPGRNT